MRQLISDCIEAVQAEIDAATRGDNSERKIRVFNGRLQRRADESCVYAFAVTREFPRSYEDAPVKLIVSGQEVGGSVVGFSEFEVTIALDDYLGQHIAEAELVIDLTFILRKLKEMLTARASSLESGSIPRKAMGLDTARIQEVEPSRAEDGLGSLNTAQQSALRKCLGSDFLMIWGPPGTGKTHVLARLLREEMLAGRTAILMSNTNVAVDQALAKFLELCETDDKLRQLFEQGRFVRIGTPQMQEVDSLVLDKVVARLNKAVQDALEERRIKRDELSNALKHTELERDRYGRLIELHAQAGQLKKALESAEAQLDTSTQEERRVSADLRQARADLDALRRKRGIGGVLAKLKEPGLQNRVTRLIRDSADAAVRVNRARERVSKAEETWQSAAAEYSRLCPNAGDPASWKPKLDELEGSAQSQRSELELINGEITELEAKLAGIRDSVVRNAQLVACTCAKSALDTSVSSRRFDAVITDESSMVSVPQALWCSGLAEHKMLCFGDFRQLPPISSIDDKQPPEYRRIMSESVFEQNGVRSDDSLRDPRLHMLDEQYRMPAEVCELVANPMYAGRLRTHLLAPRVETPLTLISTSEFNAWSDKTENSSWFNWHHAFVVVELLRQLLESELADSAQDATILILSPYRAQVEIIRALLTEAGLQDAASVSTVWRAQGREGEIVVLDTVCAPPFVKPGRWFTQPIPSSEGARLLNVAVTRAKRRLYVVAHADYLRSKCDPDSLTARILESVERVGVKISSRDLTRESLPDTADVSGGYPVLTFPAGVAAVFNETGFEQAFAADLDSMPTGSTITVFSPFLNEKSVALWGPRFRNAVQRGCRVEIFTRDPGNGGLFVCPKDVQSLIEELKSLGAFVGFDDKGVPGRKPMHYKISILRFPEDEKPPIVWKGSMNALGHYSSEELMDRTQSTELFNCVASLLKLGELQAAISGRQLTEALEEQLRSNLNGFCPIHDTPMLLKRANRTAFKSYFLGCPHWKSDGCSHTLTVSVASLNSALAAIDARCTRDDCDAPVRAKTGKNGVYFRCGDGHFVTLATRR